MEENKQTAGKDWHSPSPLTDLHVQVFASQKKEMENHCTVYSKSQGALVREALNYLFSFYSNLEQEEGKKQ